MRSILVTDLHLTDKPEDEYRWSLFPTLRKFATQHGVACFYILGDLTNDKDRHSSRLVNRVVDSVAGLREEGRRVRILRGNHDGVDPGCPYFRFLGKLDAIDFIATPYAFTEQGVEILMLPHSRDPLTEWEPVEMESANVILMHATFKGSVAENGQVMDGVPPAAVHRARKARIFSGDVHVPQKHGRVEYIGAPYPVRFGDNFEGRALLAEDWKKFTDLPIPSIKRKTITVDRQGLRPADIKAMSRGDQVKVRIRLAQDEYGEWQRVKEAVLRDCEREGLLLADVELERAEQQPLPKAKSSVPISEVKPERVLRAFCSANKVTKDVEAVGLTLLTTK